ncbi:MAG: Ppx/GppA phosphatase family protein [Gemmatimonadota bacterium]
MTGVARRWDPVPAGQVAAAIDLGTNTLLMTVGRAGADGRAEILDDLHAIARLGQGVDAARRIAPAALERVAVLLQRCRRRAEELGAAQVQAFGTSALRDAANRDEFIAAVAQRTGVSLQVLSGQEEAGLTFRGAAFGLELPDRYAVLDIGGGSTELAVGAGARLEQSASVDVGAVRLAERHFPCLPPTPAQRQAAAQTVRQVLTGLFSLPPDVPLVGVAGTVTTLGAMDLGLTAFDAEALNGHLLPAARVHALSGQLLSLPYEAIRQIPQVSEQRADIIGAGSLILDTFLRTWECPGIVVSTRGIRYGLLERLLGLA